MRSCHFDQEWLNVNKVVRYNLNVFDYYCLKYIGIHLESSGSCIES
jgi:hypothetical protein